MLIGVCGHVDHGKTALVHALTGTNADRLPEERRRGMTIDLGFAYVPAADGRILGFVDLPGHERFLHNFLAGALALDSVLLVVAADEGPRAQTFEHLAIVDRISVNHLLVAVTKCDRASLEQLAATQTAVRAMLAATSFADASVVQTSSRTGAGIETLREHLEAPPERPPAEGQGFRMAIDRAFVLPGAGLVVTGGVAAGEVAVGDQLVLSPAGIPARVRSLHAQNREQQRTQAGQRCGIALAGVDDRETARRGAWLVDPALHAPTETLLVRVRDMPGQSLRHGRDVRLHLAAETLDARVIRLGEAAGEAPYPVLLSLRRPVAALSGDRLALRDPTAHAMLAAGRVIDPFPPDRRRLRRAPEAGQLALGAADDAEALAARLAIEGAADLARFAIARNLRAEAVRVLPGSVALGSVILSPERAAELERRAVERLAETHQRFPDRLGLDGLELARSLAGDGDPAAPAAVVEDMVRRGVLRRRGGVLHLPDHQPHLSADDEALWLRLRPLLAATPERPPTVAELATALEIDWRPLRQALGRLEHFGRLQMATRNRAFLPEGLAELEQRIAELAQARPGGMFGVAEFNTAAGIGRNLCVEILEHFDRRGVTQRLGDQRRPTRPLRPDPDAGGPRDDPPDDGGVGVAGGVEPRQ
jgi:selenocysteine-specific elongation factor